MIEKLKNCELIIAPLHIKRQILKELKDKKELKNYKYMTVEELKRTLFPSYDEKAIYFLMKNHNLKYSVAKEYLENIFIKGNIIDKYREELEKENLLIKKEIYQKNITVIGYDNIEPYIKQKLNNYNTKYIESKDIINKNAVYEFEKEQYEITYLAGKIIDDLKKENIEDMYIVIPNDEYIIELKRIFKLYNIPLNIKETQSIYSLATTQTFLKELKKTKDIKKALEQTPKNETYNQIIEILNKYTFVKEIDKTLLEILENELKKTKIKSKKQKGALNIINIDQIYNKEKYYYILGFNQNVIPKIFEESEIIPDKIKKENNMYTTEEKNKIEKKKIIKILNYPNLYISYKKEDKFNSFYPSFLIEDLNLEIKREQPFYNKSNDYNKLLLASLLDDYINYGEESEIIGKLYPTYKELNYKEYNNQYKPIDKDKLKKHLKNELTLSYTSMNNYFLCPFKFYIENILKINKQTDTFPITIGNLFHYILQNIYDESFDFDKLFTSFLKEKELTKKQHFYISKFKNIIKQDIEVINKQDNLSEFKIKETEKKIIIEKDSFIKINITGIIDKISKLENYIILTDYKTGNIETTLDNIEDGLNMQLPMYIYLINKGPYKDNQIVGFYLQKLINKSYSEEEKINNLKLNGYTIKDANIIEKIDKTYQDSKVIKGMKTTKTGFYSYTKLITKEEIKKIEEIVDNNINKVIKAIESADFKINPKRINNTLISCKYCNYKDLCYYKEEDIKNIKQKPFKEIGDKDA